MVMRRYRRSFWRRHARKILITLAAIALLDLFVLLNRYKTFQSNLTSSTVHSVSELPALARNQKILICAQFWTGAKILVQHWNDDLLALIETLGRDNVYVSIYESGSFDNTEDVLRQLDARLGELGIHHRVVLDPTTHADEVAAVHDENTPGWIHTPRSGELMELRRIPYLAKLRNKVLEPLTDQTVLNKMFHDDMHDSKIGPEQSTALRQNPVPKRRALPSFRRLDVALHQQRQLHCRVCSGLPAPTTVLRHFRLARRGGLHHRD